MSDTPARTTRAGAGTVGLTVAIPVYNEERLLDVNTRRVLERLAALGVEYQVILGSNGSNDGTVARGRALEQAHPQVEFFHLPERGVGLSFREFVRRARYPVLVSLDMDLSSDLRFIDEVAEVAGSCAIVVGSKKLGPQQRSLMRKAASDLFLWSARRLTGLRFDDYSIGAKAYDVAFLRQYAGLIDAGSSYVLDLCYVAAETGRRVVCIPVACEDRRVSKFSLPREGVYKFSRLFALSRSRSRPTVPEPRLGTRMAHAGPAGSERSGS
jgi:glycosyltransferase involved in cell wall biosynthesis